MPEAPGQKSVPDAPDPENQGPDAASNGPDAGDVPRDSAVHGEASEDYVKPPWLRNGSEDEDDDTPVIRKRTILNRLRGNAEQRAAQRAASPPSQSPPLSPEARRAQTIAAIAARIREGKKGHSDLSTPDPYAVLRRKLFPGQNQVPSAFDPLDSIPVTVTALTPRVPYAPDFGYLAKDPLPCPEESPIEDLIGIYEEWRDDLEAAVAGDPTTLTVSSVRAFLNEAASLDLEIDAAMLKYMEKYAPAAKAVITQYLRQKNTLEGLIAKGTRESEALNPQEFEIRAAYENLLSDLRRQLRDVKKAFVNFLFKVLAVVSTHKVLQQILASRAEESKALLAMLSPDLPASAKFEAFMQSYDAATATTSALTPDTRDPHQEVLDILPQALVGIHRLLDGSYQPIILADAITNNGLTTDLQKFPPPIYLDPEKVMEINGAHLQAMQHAGHNLVEWSELVSRADEIGIELGLINRLALEALAPHLKPTSAPIAKRNTSRPAPPDPPADIASEPRQ